MMKWKNKKFGVVMQRRSLSFGKGEGGIGQRIAAE
jgi:hypothetical protein